jgi:hypothetical protein
MHSPEIEELHKRCVERLKDLMALSNRTCSLLESMTEFPITLDIWQRAIDQRMRENEAQARYQEARERLFDAIRPPQRL